MNKPVEEYRQRIHQKINLEIKPGVKVLDLGCGAGFDGAFFAQKGATVLGIDVLSSRHWRQLEKSFDNLSFLKANAERLSLPSASFDLVYTKDVVHHTQNPEKFLEEALRLTKKDGQLVVIEANRFNPLFYVHLTLLGNHQHFKKGDFRKLINQIKGGNKVYFLEFEAHVFPFPKSLRKVCYLLQDGLERLLLWRPFLSYNCAVIKKNG